MQDRPEVEVVDMVLRLKNKLGECESNIPVSDNVKQQLSQRIDDVVTSLPEDLKNILKVSWYWVIQFISGVSWDT